MIVAFPGHTHLLLHMISGEFRVNFPFKPVHEICKWTVKCCCNIHTSGYMYKLINIFQNVLRTSSVSWYKANNTLSLYSTNWFCGKI